MASTLEGLVGQLPVTLKSRRRTFHKLFNCASKAEAGELSEIKHGGYRKLGTDTVTT